MEYNWIIVYNKYKIEEINGIVKKQFFKEPIEDFELLNYYAKYGSFRFMIDLAINKYFVLDEKVAVRDPFYINRKENVDFIDTEEYLKFFFPKLNKREINSLIKKCRDVANDTRKEDYLTSILNEYLIYSEHYGEPLELVLNYARSLYKHFYSILDNKPLTMKLPFLSVDHLEHKIEDYSIEVEELINKRRNNIKEFTVVLNNDKPIFEKQDYEIIEGEPKYFEPDKQGRATGVLALVSKNTIPLVIKKKLKYTDPYGCSKNFATFNAV